MSPRTLQGVEKKAMKKINRVAASWRHAMCGCHLFTDRTLSMKENGHKRGSHSPRQNAPTCVALRRDQYTWPAKLSLPLVYKGHATAGHPVLLLWVAA
eukprot:2670956-Amphidinium_carterae.2